MFLLHRVTAAILFASVCLFALSVHAASAEVEVQDQNGISYVSGGVGKDQQEAVERLGKALTLKVTLATHDGHYLSGGKVAVKDDSGETLFDLSDAGPIVYVDLEPGTYTLVVDVPSFPDQTEERAVSIGDSQVTESFVWRAD